MSVPKPKKMVSRSLVIALGLICIVLIALIAYFTVTGISAQNSYDNLQNQDKQLRTWLDGNETLLNQTQTWLGDNVTTYNSQITNLQNQLKPFQGPILGFSDLTTGDNRTIPDNPYLHIEGIVHNFGIGPTLASLYVKAYHSDGSVALETSIIPNSTRPCLDIDGQSSTNVDLNYHYNGSALASWTITVEEIIVI